MLVSSVAKARNGKQLHVSYHRRQKAKNKSGRSNAGELARNPKQARAFRVSKELDAGANRWTRARATIKFLCF